jgi:hypothetical protein
MEAHFGSDADARGRARAAIATCVGGLTARAVNNPEFSSQMLAACREAVVA